MGIRVVDAGCGVYKMVLCDIGRYIIISKEDNFFSGQGHSPNTSLIASQHLTKFLLQCGAA